MLSLYGGVTAVNPWFLGQVYAMALLAAPILDLFNSLMVSLGPNSVDSWRTIIPKEIPSDDTIARRSIWRKIRGTGKLLCFKLLMTRNVGDGQWRYSNHKHRK